MVRKLAFLAGVFAIAACRELAGAPSAAPTPSKWQDASNLQDSLVLANTVAFSLALTPSRKLYFTNGTQISVYDLNDGSQRIVLSDLEGTTQLFARGEKIYFTEGGDPRGPNGSIKVYDPNSDPRVSTIATGIVYPTGIHVTPAGDLYMRNYDYRGTAEQNSGVWLLKGGAPPLTTIKDHLANGQGRAGSGLWVESTGDILIPDGGRTSPGNTGSVLRVRSDGSSITPVASNLPSPSWVFVDGNGDILFAGLLDNPRGGLYVLPATDPSQFQQIVFRHVFAAAHGNGEIYYSTARSDPEEIRVIRLTCQD